MSYIRSLFSIDNMFQPKGEEEQVTPVRESKGLIKKPFELEIPEEVEVPKVAFYDEYRTLKDLENRVQEERLLAAKMQPPERNPIYWDSAPLMQEISLEITDQNIRNILETIKSKESGGNYTVKNPQEGQTASGAYQFIDSTWRALTKKYGIGTEYKSAKEAPPEVQDLVAAAEVKNILENNNNDVTKIPLIWYTGNAQGKISQKAMAINSGMKPSQYQYDWMKRFNKISGGK